MHTQKRRYRSAEFGVNVGTSVSPRTFSEIEGLSKEFGVTKSEVLRRLVLRGLAEYHRDGKLPATQPSQPVQQPPSSDYEFMSQSPPFSANQQ